MSGTSQGKEMACSVCGGVVAEKRHVGKQLSTKGGGERQYQSMYHAHKIRH